MSAEIVERIPPDVRLELSRAGVQLIADRVGKRLPVDLTISESDILDGVAMGLLGI